jgi:hypothetical protein
MFDLWAAIFATVLFSGLLWILGFPESQMFTDSTTVLQDSGFGVEQGFGN